MHYSIVSLALVCEILEDKAHDIFVQASHALSNMSSGLVNY